MGTAHHESIRRAWRCAVRIACHHRMRQAWWCAVHAILVGVAHAAGEADLRALLAGFDGEAGLYAKDLTTGREIGVLADKPFYLASITKVFIMAAVYDKLEREGLSREHVLAFTPEDYREKTRILRDRYDDTWTVARHRSHDQRVRHGGDGPSSSSWERSN
ncbi:serine hydrolase [bacterium]|nr:serine hydrolase [bacterium]